MKQIQLKLTIDKDIELLEEWIKEDKQFAAKYKLDKFFIPTKGQKRLKAVENLINKYKKLREVMLQNRNKFHEYMANADKQVIKEREKNYKQERIIKEMAKYVDIRRFNSR